MESEKDIHVDPKLVTKLVLEAQESGDHSSEELGEELRKVVKLLICSGEFRMFTEDWKLEMASNAYVSLYNAIGKVNLREYASPFNYLYTTARHSLRKTAGRLKREEDMGIPMSWLGRGMDFGETLQLKRSKLRRSGTAVSVKEERSMISAMLHRPANLRQLVGRIMRRFSEELSDGTTLELLTMFRNRRESWTRNESVQAKS